MKSLVLNVERISKSFGLAYREPLRSTFVPFQYQCDRSFLRGLILNGYRIIIATPDYYEAEKQHVYS